MGPQWLGRDAAGASRWDTNRTWAVPCPADPWSAGSGPAAWWYDTVAATSRTLADCGFTAIWLPSPCKCDGGTRGPASSPVALRGGIFAVGYGIFDDYDLGDKLQAGHYPTRYGTREQLNRCVAMLRANGLGVYTDFVNNQRNSPNIRHPSAPAYQWFRYKDAYGNPDGGLPETDIPGRHIPHRTGRAAPPAHQGLEAVPGQRKGLPDVVDTPASDRRMSCQQRRQMWGTRSWRS